jgi:MFS family permease
VTDDRDPVQDDDLVPVSVRLGQVVPPEDPEDWTRPLTWMAAAGLLAAPAVALIWFAIAPPYMPPDIVLSGVRWIEPASLGTLLLGCSIAVGAILAGATQQGPLRAFAGTVAAALFAAVVTVGIGAAMADVRSPNGMSPTLMHSLTAATAGVIGAGVASPLAAAFASASHRWLRVVGPGLIGAALALVLVSLMMPGAMPEAA